MWVLNLSDLRWGIPSILGGSVGKNCWPPEEKLCCKKKITVFYVCGIRMVKVGCECIVVLFGGRQWWRSIVGGIGRWSRWEIRWTKTLA